MKKIRFQRKGRSGAPFYRLVILSSRAPQSSGKNVTLGIYHPLCGRSSAVRIQPILKHLKLGSGVTSNTLRVVLGQLYQKSNKFLA